MFAAVMIKDRMFGNYTEVRLRFFLLCLSLSEQKGAKKSRKFIPLSSSLSRYRKEVDAWGESLICLSNHELFFTHKSQNTKAHREFTGCSICFGPIFKSHRYAKIFAFLQSKSTIFMTEKSQRPMFIFLHYRKKLKTWILDF